MRLSTLSNAGRSFSQKPPVSNSEQFLSAVDPGQSPMSPSELQKKVAVLEKMLLESETGRQLERQLAEAKLQKMLQSNLGTLVKNLSKINVEAKLDGMSLTVNNITGHALCKCDFKTNAMQAEFSFPAPFVSVTVLQATKELKHVKHVQGNTIHFEWDDDGWSAFEMEFTSLLNLCWYDTRDASKSVYELLKLRHSKSEPPISQFPVGMHVLLETIRPQLRPSLPTWSQLSTAKSFSRTSVVSLLELVYRTA